MKQKADDESWMKMAYLARWRQGFDDVLAENKDGSENVTNSFERQFLPQIDESCNQQVITGKWLDRFGVLVAKDDTTKKVNIGYNYAKCGCGAKNDRQLTSEPIKRILPEEKKIKLHEKRKKNGITTMAFAVEDTNKNKKDGKNKIKDQKKDVEKEKEGVNKVKKDGKNKIKDQNKDVEKEKEGVNKVKKDGKNKIKDQNKDVEKEKEGVKDKSKKVVEVTTNTAKKPPTKNQKDVTKDVKTVTRQQGKIAPIQKITYSMQQVQLCEGCELENQTSESANGTTSNTMEIRQMDTVKSKDKNYPTCNTKGQRTKKLRSSAWLIKKNNQKTYFLSQQKEAVKRVLSTGDEASQEIMEIHDEDGSKGQVVLGDSQVEDEDENNSDSENEESTEDQAVDTPAYQVSTDAEGNITIMQNLDNKQSQISIAKVDDNGTESDMIAALVANTNAGVEQAAIEEEMEDEELKELLQIAEDDEKLIDNIEIEQQQEDTQAEQEEVMAEQAEVNTVQAEVNTVQAEVNTVQAEVNTEQDEVNTVQAEVNAVQKNENSETKPSGSGSNDSDNTNSDNSKKTVSGNSVEIKDDDNTDPFWIPYTLLIIICASIGGLFLLIFYIIPYMIIGCVSITTSLKEDLKEVKFDLKCYHYAFPFIIALKINALTSLHHNRVFPSKKHDEKSLAADICIPRNDDPSSNNTDRIDVNVNTHVPMISAQSKNVKGSMGKIDSQMSDRTEHGKYTDRGVDFKDMNVQNEVLDTSEAFVDKSHDDFEDTWGQENKISKKKTNISSQASLNQTRSAEEKRAGENPDGKEAHVVNIVNDSPSKKKRRLSKPVENMISGHRIKNRQDVSEGIKAEEVWQDM